MNKKNKKGDKDNLLILTGGLCIIISQSLTDGNILEGKFIYLSGILIIVGLIIGVIAQKKKEA